MQRPPQARPYFGASQWRCGLIDGRPPAGSICGAGGSRAGAGGVLPPPRWNRAAIMGYRGGDRQPPAAADKRSRPHRAGRPLPPPSPVQRRPVAGGRSGEGDSE